MLKQCICSIGGLCLVCKIFYFELALHGKTNGTSMKIRKPRNQAFWVLNGRNQPWFVPCRPYNRDRPTFKQQKVGACLTEVIPFSVPLIFGRKQLLHSTRQSMFMVAIFGFAKMNCYVLALRVIYISWCNYFTFLEYIV